MASIREQSEFHNQDYTEAGRNGFGGCLHKKMCHWALTCGGERDGEAGVLSNSIGALV